MVISMDKEQMNTLGAIHIAGRAVSVIAAIAAAQVEGVVMLHSNLADSVAAMLGKGASAKGISTSINGDIAEIRVSLVVRYGSRIPDIALRVQEAVKENVEAMTGYNVRAVNIVIQSIDFNQAGGIAETKR